MRTDEIVPNSGVSCESQIRPLYRFDTEYLTPHILKGGHPPEAPAAKAARFRADHGTAKSVPYKTLRWFSLCLRVKPAFSSSRHDSYPQRSAENPTFARCLPDCYSL